MNTIPGINGLRALSILMVVWYHFHIQNMLPATGFDNWIYAVICGALGVNIFFVISGFLITTLLIAEENKNGRVSLKNFYLRRIFRIFPAYYFLLLVYFIMQCAGYVHITARSWFTALIFCKQFNWSKDWITAHLWSLSVEEFFYLLWPFLFITLFSLRKKIAVVLIILVVLLRVILMKWQVAGIDAFTIFERGDALMAGCLVALNSQALLNSVKTHRFINPLVVLIMLIGSVLIPVSISYLKIPHISLYLTTLFGAYGIITNLLVAALILVSINAQGVWPAMLNNPAIILIGKMSYSIYLWQQLFTNGQFGAWQALLLIFTMASFSYFIVEKPFLKLKAKFSEV